MSTEQVRPDHEDVGVFEAKSPVGQEAGVNTSEHTQLLTSVQLSLDKLSFEQLGHVQALIRGMSKDLNG